MANVTKFDGLLEQIEQDHARLDAELEKEKKDLKHNEEELQVLNKEIEKAKTETTTTVSKIRFASMTTDELIDKEEKLREQIFGTDENKEQCKLYQLTKMKLEVSDLKARKDHGERRLMRLNENEEMQIRLSDHFEQNLPQVKELLEVKVDVDALEKDFENLCAGKSLEEIQQEVEHLKELISAQKSENDKIQETSVNKKKEKKMLEGKQKQVELEIRSLENRNAAKKKRLTNTIQELESKLETQQSMAISTDL